MKNKNILAFSVWLIFISLLTPIRILEHYIEKLGTYILAIIIKEKY